MNLEKKSNSYFFSYIFLNRRRKPHGQTCGQCCYVALVDWDVDYCDFKELGDIENNAYNSDWDQVFENTILQCTRVIHCLEIKKK